MLKINLAFARSSMCLVHFSSVDRDGLARVMEREANIPLFDDPCRLSRQSSLRHDSFSHQVKELFCY
jgi:hypothetical protein